MHFAFHGLSEDDFKAWIAQAKSQGTVLDRAAYLQLEKPSENEPVHRYTKVDDTLFKAIIQLCVEPGKMCTDEMSAIDAKGGLGVAGLTNLIPLQYDKQARRGAVFGAAPSYVASLCTPEHPTGLKQAAPFSPVPSTAQLTGAGLPRPSLMPFSPAPEGLVLGAARSSNS